jgi:hypothetical protein
MACGKCNKNTVFLSGYCRKCYLYYRLNIGKPARIVPQKKRYYKHGTKIVLTGRDYAREVVRVRDSYTCQACGKLWREGMRRFDVHHLNGLCGKRSTSYDKIIDIDGLITLCHRCHFNHPQHSLKLLA